MAQSNNRFAYGGALGGLIAADETIQKEITSRLDNIQKAITNADAALDLNLAQKYRESGVKADIAKKQADARKGTAEAIVAEETVPFKVAQEKAGVGHTRALTQAAVAQAEEADARARELPANAAAQRAANYASAEQSQASAQKLRDDVARADDIFNLRERELDAKVRKVDADISAQATMLDLRASELQIQKQTAETQSQRVAIDQQLADIAKRRMNLESLMSVAINEKNLASAAASRAEAAKRLAEAGAEAAAGSGSAAGLKGEALNTRLGISNPDETAGSVVNQAMMSSPEWKALRPSEVDEDQSPKALELRSIAKEKVADALFRYKQLASLGLVTPFDSQDLKRILMNTLLAVHPDPSSLEEYKTDERSRGFFEAHNTNLASIRTKMMGTKSPQRRAQLGQLYSNTVVAVVNDLVERDAKIPMELLFDFTMIQAQPKSPLNITINPE